MSRLLDGQIQVVRGKRVNYAWSTTRDANLPYYVYVFENARKGTVKGYTLYGCETPGVTTLDPNILVLTWFGCWGNKIQQHLTFRTLVENVLRGQILYCQFTVPKEYRYLNCIHSITLFGEVISSHCGLAIKIIKLSFAGKNRRFSKVLQFIQTHVSYLVVEKYEVPPKRIGYSSYQGLEYMIFSEGSPSFVRRALPNMLKQSYHSFNYYNQQCITVIINVLKICFNEGLPYHVLCAIANYCYPGATETSWFKIKFSLDKDTYRVGNFNFN